MNPLLADVFTGLIIDDNATHYFIQKDGQTFSVSKTEGEHAVGDVLKVFGYANEKGKLMATTNIPNVRKGHYGVGVVTSVRRDLGVFVNIGLEKDIVVSLDEMPSMKELWPKEGDQLTITLSVDAKNRIWGNLASEEYFRAGSTKGHSAMKNKNIEGVVFRLKLIGTYFYTEDNYIAFVHPSERFREPRLGEKVQARIIGVRPDGVLNCSMKPRAHEAISDDANMVLTFLERSENKEIPYTDKSTPEEILAIFGISKGQFKRALGSLMKAGKIEQTQGVTRLLMNEVEEG